MYSPKSVIIKKIESLKKEYKSLHDLLCETQDGVNISRSLIPDRKDIYQDILKCYISIKNCKKALINFSILRKLPLPDDIILTITVEMLIITLR